MSIFGSHEAPDDSEHTDECGGWRKEGDLWSFDGPCDCGQPDAPLVYQGSHVLPSDGDKRGGFVDIASIPSHVTRDGRDALFALDSFGGGFVIQSFAAYWFYLRFGVNQETVILTRRNVAQVAGTLAEWLGAVRDE